jgi:hypothetical protein
MFYLQALWSFWNHLKQKLPLQSWRILNLNICHCIWNGLHLIPSQRHRQNQIKGTEQWRVVKVVVVVLLVVAVVVVVVVVVIAAVVVVLVVH